MTAVAHKLLASLATQAPRRNRASEAEKAQARGRQREERALQRARQEIGARP